MGGILPTRSRDTSHSSRAAKENRRLLSEGRMNKRMLAMLLDENEPIRLSLDDQAFVFLDGTWLPDFSARDYRKLSKQNQFLVAENGLLKVKVDILLELITGRTAEKPKKLLTNRRDSVIKTLHQEGYGAEASSSNIELAMPHRNDDAKSTLASTDLEGILFAIGDPLLDIVVADVPSTVLQKHRLDADSGTLMGEEQEGLVEELLSGSYETAYVPGGSEQNCLKVVQRLVGVPHATTYLGCIGRDRNGEILESAMKECGINARYQLVDQPTGLCYICLTGVKRSLVTNLGAAQNPVLDLLKTPAIWELVEKAKYFYVEAYSVANRFEETLLIARHALQQNKVFAMNLSCPYLSSKYKEQLNEVLPYVDLLFGSELEALAFGDARGLDTSEIGDIALSLARMSKANGRRGRLVILTRGKNPVVAVNDGQVRLFPVIPVPAEDIQDTVGAGDSFAGGYLAALVTGHKHDECMRAALGAAHYVIRLRGCEILPNFNESLGLHLSPESLNVATTEPSS